MPFPKIELPPDFDLPRTNDTPRNRSLANLKHLGRRKGSQDKISRDLKNGILDAAIAHGRDGEGTDGLAGYLFLLASENRKTFASLLARILPYNVSATTSAQTISEVRILSIPSGQHYSAADLRRVEQGQSTIDALPPPERYDEPPDNVIAEPVNQDFKPQTERERRLLAELEALTPEQLMERAKQVGYFDVADGV
jgi:hypothetical protein